MIKELNSKGCYNLAIALLNFNTKSMYIMPDDEWTEMWLTFAGLTYNDYKMTISKYLKLKQDYLGDDPIIRDYLSGEYTVRSLTAKYHIGARKLYKILGQNNISKRKQRLSYD